MSDLPPFAQALLSRRPPGSVSSHDDDTDEYSTAPRRVPSPEISYVSPRNRLFPPYCVSPPRRSFSPQSRLSLYRRADLEEANEGDVPPRQLGRYSGRKRVRRQFLDDSSSTNESDYRRVIGSLKQKNKMLKGRVQSLTRENHEIKRHLDDDPDNMSEVERLRHLLKEEQVRSKLHQDKVRALENEIKTKDQIIETKDILIKRLQISCQEQANEYTRVADQIKLHMNMSPIRDSIADIDPKLFELTARRIDINNVGINNNFGLGLSDKFNDGFNNQPLHDEFNDNIGAPPLNDRFDNYGVVPPSFANDFKQKQGMNAPEGFEGRPYNEDMPVGAARSRANQNPFGQDSFLANNHDANNSEISSSPEDIRKQIDVLLPQKQELERKLNLIPPKGKESEYQRNKEKYEQELSDVNKRISRLKLSLRQMKVKPRV